MQNKPVSAYFETDHDRLDLLFKHFQKTKRVNFQEAKPFFRNFLRGLKRHIIWEEEILFPVFERKSGPPSGVGPTEVMRREHRAIQEALELIHAKVRQADPESDDLERSLLEILAAHNQKEEQVLYPAIDSLVSEDELARIFVQMEEVPEDRWKTCCGHK
jgi:hemerythrin superfamily protein